MVRGHSSREGGWVSWRNATKADKGCVTILWRFYNSKVISEIDQSSLIQKDRKTCTNESVFYADCKVYGPSIKCCTPPRSSYFKMFSAEKCFIPPTIHLTQSNVGITASESKKKIATLLSQNEHILPNSKKVSKISAVMIRFTPHYKALFEICDERIKISIKWLCTDGNVPQWLCCVCISFCAD